MACGREVVALGLCSAHHQQWHRAGILKPLRERGGRVRLPGANVAVAPRTRRKAVAEAKRRRVTVTEIVRDVLDRWAEE